MSFWSFFNNKLKGLFGIKNVGKTDSVGAVREAGSLRGTKVSPVSVTSGASGSSKNFDYKDGKEASPGTSDSEQALPKNEERDFIEAGDGLDSRNSNVVISENGSAVDEAPQSWENTTRQPNRNGNQSDSDLVSRIAFDAINGTTTIETKRGGNYEVEDNGSLFNDIEAAGSKGRYTVANYGV